MREVTVYGVRVEMPSGIPMLLLKELEGSRVIPIWIGAAEAAAIANALESVEPPRPLTHDLFAVVLAQFDLEIEQVELTHLDGGTFHAVIVIDGQRISARPSDAVALAVRLGTTVYCSEELLDQVGVEVSESSDEEVEKFREFLDTVSPEDFDQS